MLMSVLCVLCMRVGLLMIGLAKVTRRQRTSDDRLRWKWIDVTGWTVFVYLEIKDLIGWFRNGHTDRDKPKEKMRKKDRLEQMWMCINILSWSRAKYLKVLSEKMVLSSYMMSPSYCGNLKRKGQNRVGFLGQIKRIVKNCLYLILLINIIQGRNLRSKVDRAKHQGIRVYKSMRQLPSLRETF
eukprot:15333441-Ditylum_brightwellii.AAC.1